MRRELIKPLIVIFATFIVAFALFGFGMGYPYLYRYLGHDSFNYLVAANQFDSFSNVLSYAGDRGVGMPFFAFVIRKVVTIISPENDLRLYNGHFLLVNNLRIWVDCICFALFFIHLVSAWLFSTWLGKTKLLKSENLILLLFAFLATYPAFIGHTTVFLSDTLDVDLILCAIVFLEKALNAKRLTNSIIISCAAAFFFALTILVRPGALWPVAISVGLACAASTLRSHRAVAVLGATTFACMMMLLPFYQNCTEKYGVSCLQSPKTFDVISHARSGLVGARILWERKQPNLGDMPVLPDQFMVDNYYNRCHLTSVLGLGEESFSGCLISRPSTLPLFMVKKWIGFFDHFRFTPYTENLTPVWLKWLSRAYDSLAWLGFSLLFAAAPMLLKPRLRANMKALIGNNVTPIALLGFSIVMLAELTLFHVEDRYGLPLVPLSIAVLIIFCERSLALYRARGWKSIAPLFLFCVATCALFVTQIVMWDFAAI